VRLWPKADREIAPRNVRFQGVKQILKFEGVTSAFDQERRFATAVSE